MHRLRAFLLLLSILTLWVASGFLHFDIPFTNYSLYAWHVYLFATLCRFIPHPFFKRFNRAFWMWTDQGVNVFHGGNEDVTVSSKVGYREEQGSKTAATMAAVINSLWYIGTGQKNHCISAIERDEEHY